VALRIRDWQVLLPVLLLTDFIAATAYFETAGIRSVSSLFFALRNWDHRAFMLALVLHAASIYIVWTWRDVNAAPSGGVG
jgi:hypothetical protein